MYNPCLKIYLDKISHNSRIINDRCSRLGISVISVTKCVLGNIQIARAIKKSGISIFGDSRLENLLSMRKHFGSRQKLVMLRSPMASELEVLVSTCNISMNTQLEIVGMISKICERKKGKHNIIVMVEIDDKREGLLIDSVAGFCREVVKKYKWINIYGLGTNARCITNKNPTMDSFKILIGLKKDIEAETGKSLKVISGGNSSIWNLIESGQIPGGINQVRIGEAILLGHDTLNYDPIKGTYQDCFVLQGEIIETKKRKGEVNKIILALGIQDVDCRNIFCQDPILHIIGQSSDHTILGIKKSDTVKIGPNNLVNLEAGNIISFNLNYFGLLSCMTSPFVKKHYVKV